MQREGALALPLAFPGSQHRWAPELWRQQEGPLIATVNIIVASGMQKSKRRNICCFQVADEQKSERGGRRRRGVWEREINKTSLVCAIYHKQPGGVWGRENCQQRSVFLRDCGSRCSRRKNKDGSLGGTHDQTPHSRLNVNVALQPVSQQDPLPFWKHMLQDPELPPYFLVPQFFSRGFPELTNARGRAGLQPRILSWQRVKGRHR